MTRADRETGFTLVEVLVALVIAALLTAILLDGASMARARAQRADKEARAVFLARNLLVQAGAADLGTTEHQGKTNNLVWTLSENVILRDPRGFYALVEIQARITDEHGVALFSAETRRLKVLPQA